MKKNVLQLGVLFLGFILISNTLFAQAVNVSGIVKGPDGKALSGATIIETGTSNATVSNATGGFSLKVSGNGAKVRIEATGLDPQELAVSGSLDVQLKESVNSQLDPVIVVGSRVARTALKSAVPVDVISFKNITQTLPQTDVNQILTYLAPSFQSNRQSASDGTEHIDPASLRGLGPDQLLVLVNGKRRHNSSLLNYQGTVGNGSVGTDLNAIPAAAIERIEVLRDGAAAQYGSDAIAGVINVVLKKNNSGTLVNTGVGITSKGDGLNGQFNFNQGT
ncbi:MAG: TonB-dependent receptor, partial [Ferruginibacter sp.]